MQDCLFVNAAFDGSK